jgi:hypothetical protein
MISASVIAAKAGDIFNSISKLHSWKKRFMASYSSVRVKVLTMVQDLLIELHVHPHAHSLCLNSTFSPVSNLWVLDAVRVFAHRFALWTPVFLWPSVDAQVFANEAFPRGQALECLRSMASQRPKQCK